MEPCTKDKELGAMQTSIAIIEKEIFGNGHEGLIKTVPVLAANVKQLNDTTKDLRTTISALNKFMDETGGSRSVIRNMTPWIAVVIAFLGLTFTVVTTSKIKGEQYRMENILQYKQDRLPDPTTRGGVKAIVNEKKNESSTKP